MNYLNEDNDQSIINITSLIDIVFLLLIFFVLTTTFNPKMNKITMNMPTTNKIYTPAQIEKNPTISIDKNNKVFFNNTETNKKDLPKLLQPFLNSRKTLLIRADKEVKHGTIISIIDIIQNTGFNNFAFVTKHENISKNYNSNFDNIHTSSK